MNAFSRQSAALVAVAALAFADSPVAAVESNVVVPGGYANVDGGGGSALLFEPERTQDIYASCFFPPDPVTFRSIKMRSSTVYGSAFSATISHFKISMSTTLTSPASPSLTFSNNIGLGDAGDVSV